MDTKKGVIKEILNKRFTKAIAFIVFVWSSAQILYLGFDISHLDTITLLLIAVSAAGVLLKRGIFYWPLIITLSIFIIEGSYGIYYSWNLYFTQKAPGLFERIKDVLPIFIVGVIVPLCFVCYFAFQYARERKNASIM